MKKEIIVIRFSSRIIRDERVNTHCVLVTRAFGGKEIYFNQEQKELKKRIEKINKEFGGSLKIKEEKNTMKLIKKLKKQGFAIINLTMYGEPIKEKIDEIRKKEKIGIMIGSEKVPIKYYKESNYNISITNQPHSEIAALAIFLHELQKTKKNIGLKNAKKIIIPSKNHKKIILK